MIKSCAFSSRLEWMKCKLEKLRRKEKKAQWIVEALQNSSATSIQENYPSNG